jgi:hypothetical protein
MCLEYRKEITDKVRKSFKGKQCIYVYKLLKVDYLNGELFSDVYSSHHWFQGMNVSNRESVELDAFGEVSSVFSNTGLVFRGFHVYLKNQPAVYRNCCIVRLTARPKDFVAAGLNGEAVFTRLRLSKKEYKKALKERKE